MDSRKKTTRKRNSANAQEEFRVLEQIVHHITSLPEIYKAAATKDGTFKDAYMQRLIDLGLQCKGELEKTKEKDYSKSHINAVSVLQSIMKGITDSFIMATNAESGDKGIGRNSPAKVAAVMNENISGYHLSRLLGLLLGDIYREIDERKLPSSKEIHKWAQSKEKEVINACHQTVTAIKYPEKNIYPNLESISRGPIGDSDELRRHVHLMLARIYRAPEIYEVLSSKDKSKEEIEWLLRLYELCNAVVNDEENVERDVQGKFTRILKILSDEFALACNLAKPGERSVLTSPRNESPRKGDSPRDRESPRSPRVSTLTESPRTGTSPRVSGTSPRLRSRSLATSPFQPDPPRPRSGSFIDLRRSLSAFKPGSPKPESPRSPRSAHSVDEAAEMINSDDTQYHYARLLGLMLGEMVRLMERPDMPSLRPQDKLLPSYQLALMIQFPASVAENYNALNLTTAAPGQEKVKSPRSPRK